MNNTSTVIRSDEIRSGQFWNCTCKDIYACGVEVMRVEGDDVVCQYILRPYGNIRINIWLFKQCFKPNR